MGVEERVKSLESKIMDTKQTIQGIADKSKELDGTLARIRQLKQAEAQLSNQLKAAEEQKKKMSDYLKKQEDLIKQEGEVEKPKASHEHSKS